MCIRDSSWVATQPKAGGSGLAVLLDGPQGVSASPERFVVRGRCGQSPLRLDIQLRAASPVLELILTVDWRQRHELLRLELPLGQAALRYAADTSAGVLERPAQPMTPREEARWEVTAISWAATQPKAGGSGLAVLLDGPQGVSVSPERLGVSLLRAPTWPDPSADNGIQRLRLALAPCQDGWSSAGAPRLAQRFREPLWLRPAQRRAENTAGSRDAVSPIDLMLSLIHISEPTRPY